MKLFLMEQQYLLTVVNKAQIVCYKFGIKMQIPLQEADVICTLV
jgi:hypothetical protein